FDLPASPVCYILSLHDALPILSSGSSGFWFFNCVVRMRRNVSKFPARLALFAADVVGTPDPALGAVPVAEVTALAMVAMVSAIVHTLMSTPPPSPIRRP